MDLPSLFGTSQPRFYVEHRSGGLMVRDRTGLLGSATSIKACADLLNKLDDEVRHLRMLDAEWWTLASGEGVGTPDDETRNRVKMKCDTLLHAFYERGKRAGRTEAEEAAKKKTPAKRGSR